MEPKDVWMAIAAIALVFGGWKYFNPPPEPATNQPTTVAMQGYGDQAQLVKLTERECVATGDRLWVSSVEGLDCITVITPPNFGRDGKSTETVLVFIDGDVPDSDQNEMAENGMRRAYVRMAETESAAAGIPVLIVARPGVLGSSGAHRAGGMREDANVIFATLDALKRRYGVRRFAMAGQSGGARMIAQLMVLGRRDIACGVMGSGAYDLPRKVGGGRATTNIFGDPGRRFIVPMLRASEIPDDRDRRLFVIGDKRDQITVFEEQQAFAAKLAGLNHHVVLIETTGQGDKNHGTATQSRKAAAQCIAGRSDADIVNDAGKHVPLSR